MRKLIYGFLLVSFAVSIYGVEPASKVERSGMLAGHVWIDYAADAVRVSIDQDPADGIIDHEFVLQVQIPMVAATEEFASARIVYGPRRVTIRVAPGRAIVLGLEDPVDNDLRAEDALSSAFKSSDRKELIGYGLAHRTIDWTRDELLAERVDQRNHAPTPDFDATGQRRPAPEETCPSGGCGSTSCGIDCSKTGCNVTCSSGFFSCCLCQLGHGICACYNCYTGCC